MEFRLILIPLLTQLSFCQAKRPFIVELNTFNCVTVMPSLVSDFSCIIYRKRIVPVVYVRFTLAETVKQFHIHFNLDILKKDNTKMHIADSKLDGCKYLNALYGNNIYGKFFKRIQMASNIPKRCPVQRNKLFEIRNYTILADEYPPGVPALTYQLRLKLLRADELFADVLLEGAVVY